MDTNFDSKTFTNTNVGSPAQQNDEGSGSANKLQMSFADWKKSKDPQPPEQKTFNKPQRQQQNQRQRPPQQNRPNMPPPLMSINMNGCNFMPPPLMGCGGNMNRPLQPPPFWEDMIMPMQRQPPIQPPMPPPALLFENRRPWQNKPKHNHKNPNKNSSNNNENKKQQQSANKSDDATKVNASDKTANGKIDQANVLPTESELSAAILMPPPPPPPLPPSDNPNQSNLQQQQQQPQQKKKIKQKYSNTWMTKPLPPPPLDEKDPGTKEERQRQWKEYRQAMKPFKNREFHNAKRCVQRLSKVPAHELDEKQRERLQKSEQFIAEHKAMLSVKHAERWVPKETADGKDGDLSGKAQIFVRKPISAFWEKWNTPNSPNPFRKNVPIKQYIGISSVGRAIKGGQSGGVERPGPQPVAAPTPFATTPTAVAAAAVAMPSAAQQDYYEQQCYSGGFNPAPGSASSSQYFVPGYTANFIKGDTLLPGTF